MDSLGLFGLLAWLLASRRLRPGRCGGPASRPRFWPSSSSWLGWHRASLRCGIWRLPSNRLVSDLVQVRPGPALRGGDHPARLASPAQLDSSVSDQRQGLSHLAASLARPPDHLALPPLAWPSRPRGLPVPRFRGTAAAGNVGLSAFLLLILAGCAGTTPATQSPSPSSGSTTTAPAADGLPPDGSWQVELSADDLVAAGWPADVTAPGTYTWTFGAVGSASP